MDYRIKHANLAEQIAWYAHAAHIYADMNLVRAAQRFMREAGK